MNILIERKSKAFNKLNLFWNLSDRLNRGAKWFSIISPGSGIRSTIKWTREPFQKDPKGLLCPRAAVSHRVLGSQDSR